MIKNHVYVIGAGGHAKVVVRTLQALGHIVAAIFDDNPDRWGAAIFGVPVLGPVERIEDRPRLPTLIAIGNNAARQHLAERYSLPWTTAVHPQALVDPSVRLGRGTIVMPCAVVEPDSHISDHVIINTAAVVGHDCVVAQYAHIGPGVHLAGGVTVGDGALVGIGAVAIPGVTLGAYSIVAAGAAVVADVPPRGVAVGVPARGKRPPRLRGRGSFARRDAVVKTPSQHTSRILGTL